MRLTHSAPLSCVSQAATDGGTWALEINFPMEDFHGLSLDMCEKRLTLTLSEEGLCEEVITLTGTALPTRTGHITGRYLLVNSLALFSAICVCTTTVGTDLLKLLQLGVFRESAIGARVVVGGNSQVQS